MPDDLNCPICHLMDRTLKVSSIVTGQTHQIHGSSYESSTYVDKDGKTRTSYYTAPYNATQTSVLAQQLRPPKEPEVPQPISRSSLIISWWGIILLTSLVTSPCWGMCLLVGISELFGNLTLNGNDVTLMPARIIFLLGIAVGLIIAFFVVRAIFKSIDRTVEKRQREIAEIQAEIPRWEHAMQRWNQLYYCERDDLIFIPSEKTWASREQMMDYIYQ
jgi:hypothetical protein